MKHFRFSLLFTAICLGLSAWWGYEHGGWSTALTALGIASILGIMEISLSFDNAVVNAAILKGWDEFWRKLFLTVGILIAVFGMRLVFPLVIVAQAADLGVVEVWNLALQDPKQFSTHLTNHHAEVAVFGGVFLLLVFLNFLFDENKKLHWLGNVEKKMASFGRIGSIPVLLSLLLVLGSVSLVDDARKLVVLSAGIWGIVVYVGVDFISSLLEKEDAEGAGASAASAIKKGSLGGFLYLELLDASFSFDGVIGAFAITNDVVIIMLGLAIGAIFVRSMTVYLVHQGTLEEFVYLEHGAHYAIGILALIMFASVKFHISEIFTGLVGVAFIFASIWSSVLYKRRQQKGAGAATHP
ncbi:MAG: hypothetical protein RLZZ618_4204 [Pseudomonadota bacterium]|jgi:hypothetical protein